MVVQCTRTSASQPACSNIQWHSLPEQLCTLHCIVYKCGDQIFGLEQARADCAGRTPDVFGKRIWCDQHGRYCIGCQCFKTHRLQSFRHQGRAVPRDRQCFLRKNERCAVQCCNSDAPIEQRIKFIGTQLIKLVLHPEAMAARCEWSWPKKSSSHLWRKAFWEAGPKQHLSRIAQMLKDCAELEIDDPDLAARQLAGSFKGPLFHLIFARN